MFSMTYVNPYLLIDHSNLNLRNPKDVKLSTRQMLLDIGSMAHYARYLLEVDKARVGEELG